jgi:hypothetical protein
MLENDQNVKTLNQWFWVEKWRECNQNLNDGCCLENDENAIKTKSVILSGKVIRMDSKMDW